MGAETLEFPDGMKPYFDEKLRLPANPDALDFNANWFQNKLDINTRVFDLGAKGNFIQSPFYNLEVGRSLGYPYLTPVNYNSYFGGRLRITTY